MKKYISCQYSRRGSVVIFSLILLFMIGAPELNAQTTGTMTFSVRTVTYNGDRSPKHILAIWAEDSQGFVKTRKLRAATRKQWLLTFNSRTGGNVVDATTGATLNSHTTHTVTWDCTDVSGTLIPDGTYTIYVEFTEEHAQGPIYTLEFTKGPNSVSLSPSNETYFKDISLAFEPNQAAAVAGFTYVVEQETVTFTNTSSNADSYAWVFGDGNTSEEQDPIHVYTSDGDYTVELTASNESSNDAYQKSITITGITSVLENTASAPGVYPIPTKDVLVIDAGELTAMDAVKIYGIDGKLYYSKDKPVYGKHSISIADYKAGVYMLQIDRSGESFSYKVVKE